MHLKQELLQHSQAMSRAQSVILEKVNYPDPKGVPESILAKTGTRQVSRSPGLRPLVKDPDRAGFALSRW
jgi:hypothetical protein